MVWQRAKLSSGDSWAERKKKCDVTPSNQDIFRPGEDLEDQFRFATKAQHFIDSGKQHALCSLVAVGDWHSGWVPGRMQMLRPWPVSTSP